MEWRKGVMKGVKERSDERSDESSDERDGKRKGLLPGGGGLYGHILKLYRWKALIEAVSIGYMSVPILYSFWSKHES